MSNSVEEKMDTETTGAKPAADLETLKAAAREVVKEAEESHVNGNGDSSDNGVHENGSSVEGDEEMDTGGEDNENDNDTGNENDNDTGGEGENGSSVEDEDPLGEGGEEDSADNGDPLGGDDEESRDETEENGDKEEDNENSNDSGDQDPLGGGDSEIHSDTNNKAVNGNSDKEKAAKVTNGEIDNGDSAENSDEEGSDDDIIIDKDDTNAATNNTTPKKKKIEEVTLDDAGLRRSSRKKTPTKYAEMEMGEEAELIEEIEEIRDDDSDIVEVDAEDPLTTPTTASISITKSTKTSSAGGGAKKPNVVTIDDLKTLQLLATSAKKTIDSQKNANRLDTQAILAGKMGSGVSITPAKPKFNIGAQGLTLGSGVTIKPNTPKIPSSVTITSSSVSPATQSVPSPVVQPEQEEYDPNLTDDTFVVEAPSFIVPYVYEKPPKEEIKAFLEEIKKMRAELEEKEKKEEVEKKKARKEESKKRREARQKRRDDGEDDVSSDSEDEKEEEEVKVEEKKEKPEEKVEEKKEDEDKKEETEVKEGEEKKEGVEAPKPAPPKTAAQLYFDSTLGKFFSELGMNLVQEYVQKDLLHSQKRRALKDKSVAVMHAISSLQKNLDDSEETNAVFHHDMRKCRFCSFRTESRIVMAHHMETPHMRNFVYRCNFCEFETKIPQEVLFHMDSIHGVKGKLERAPYYHQCPQCSFEDNGKGKLTRHRVGCDKRFKPDMNLNPERDWEPPAKIKAVVNRPAYPNLRPGQIPPGVLPGGRHVAATLQPRNLSPAQQRMGMMSAASRNAALANRGRPVGTYKPGFQGVDLRIPQPNLAAQVNKLRGLSPQMLSGQQMLAALNQQGLSVLGKNSPGGKAGSPSISITPLPGRNSPAGAAAKKGTASPQMKPGQPGGTGKGSFVICEICDGYIKDLEQLRNHMQWIHKVKIHPKMIHNRPPLNCQKCQFRFFTDQGLERHLLGSHGLVTASMQDAANKGQDSGRCPVCGKVYQWKLLNHVAKDHNKTLKPAHLSYKCTVCTATFGQYKLFENHVYTAHSGVAKKTDKSKQGASGSGLQKTVNKPSPAPQPKKPPQKAEVIDLDDEEEIDDVEKDDNKKSSSEVIDLDTTPKKSGGEAVKRSADSQAASAAKKPKVVEKDPLEIDPLEITEEDKANAVNDDNDD